MEESNDIGVSNDAMYTLASYSAMAGLCPLIPIPFLDDFIIDRFHRRMLQKLTRPHDVYLAVKDAKYLTSKPSNLLSGAVKSLVLWPIKKLVRKVVYVLAIKSCADVATAVFHEGWLFARALERGYVEPAALGRGDKEVLEKLRDAINKSVDEVDPDATQQVMNSAFGVGREVIDSLGTALKGVLGDDEDTLDDKMDAAEEQVGPLTERIIEELRAHWELSDALDQALRRELSIEQD